MNQIKQNIMVVAILFLSLLSSVVLSYAITPTAVTEVEHKQVTHKIKAEGKAIKKNLSLHILLPKLVK